MGVSMNYSFSRAVALSPEEKERFERIVNEANEADSSSAEPIAFYEADWAEQPYLHGSSKIPLEPEAMHAWVLHTLATLTALRRAFPDAEWGVDLEDAPADWDEREGFTFEGLEQLAAMEGDEDW